MFNSQNINFFTPTTKQAVTDRKMQSDLAFSNTFYPIKNINH